MVDACPIPGPGDPLVHSLLFTTDCHVEDLVRTGYGSLFESSGPFSTVLTILLTVYVALIGYQLLLGRSQLNVSDFALTAVKLGAVVALATQWGTYQTVVYRFLFDAPQEVANGILQSLGAHGTVFGGDVFSGLQRAFNDLTAFSPATPPGAPAPVPAPTLPPGSIAAAPVASALGPQGQIGQLSTLLSKSGFDSLLLLVSAVVLLLSSLGVLLAAKIVLGLLLAVGPIFIALLLFDSTRGLFEGWLRASLGFAFAPLAVTLLLGLALTLLGPSLAEIETMRDTNTYTPGVAFGVLVLVLVFAAVSAGMMVAAAVIAGGFKLPRFASTVRTSIGVVAPATTINTEAAPPARAARVAAAAVAQERRDATLFARAAGASVISSDRRTVVATERGGRDPVVLETRLGQTPRRNARPRTARSGARSGR